MRDYRTTRPFPLGEGKKRSREAATCCNVRACFPLGETRERADTAMELVRDKDRRIGFIYLIDLTEKN